MVNYKVVEINDQKVWDGFVVSTQPQSFLQSWNWGETNSKLGKQVWRLGYYDKKTLVGVCMAIMESAKRGPHLLVPGGPVINWKNKKLVDIFVESVNNLARKERVWFVRFRPELLDNSRHRSLMKSLGFVVSPMHLHAQNTWVLDISRSEDEIMSGMRKTTRYLIRQAIGLDDLKVTFSNSNQNVSVLGQLQKETASRHRFVGFSQTLFKAQMDTFGGDEQAFLFVCYHRSIPLNAAIIIFYNDIAYYHHSASTLKFPKTPSSYLLQWEIIKEAKRRGCRKYNLWGIAPTDDPNHRFYGVTVFKKGFGGLRVDWLPAFDIPLSSFYWLTHFFEKIRKKVRRL
ncbi:MAG: methicillin resistance protein [uncultured bacterium]|uniref:BioF2-like acetyltransferase domain-containing protein n=1 Tax=Candidatus Woesebacteria bacterium RIFCSPHIGHO2_12_FULL_41_24 TaxID=1802510 RepID=A0A1F8AQ31_9BACT|nr:MAG: methicillin resistance protein [uncultured bacterium]OGM13266.1 MAG: hypothetical protein A2W15_05065 [Candidatus Woesebacteria bacterium RBG_16_41_13]OGM30668.1 MAG: hypothetical protein A2873_00960 [Candidatus Woesebacteria bacterium RIFCSPHIGHO2_01_FULL_42_80]OGM35805.1 MAG: hypothetical protein A3D84_00840 [Candidatus Woesebacteria bacterium RIFCSPHIGHO2_02_FULL_42_20]OGM53864.1 MAG: hypothetical protein A3E44_05610 [Candidatus Woesebacteria bacterium RIFCSPHIGHO2_12_FULL_41_24]OGM